MVPYRVILFRWRKLLSGGALSGSIFATTLALVSNGELKMWLSEAWISGDGFLVTRDGICNLAAEQELIPGAERKLGLLTADGGTA